MKQKIETLLQYDFSEIEDIELVSHIYNHICILESGYLEKQVESILKQYKSS